LRLGSHWKDRATGHGDFRIDGPCPECGKAMRDTVFGTRQSVYDLIRGGHILCRQCEERS
jgi:hypothetical protein